MYRFSLRTLLLGSTAIMLAGGVASFQLRRVQAAKDAIHRIQAVGGVVELGEPPTNSFVARFSRPTILAIDLNHGADVDARVLSDIARFEELERIEFPGDEDISEVDFRALAKCRNLQDVFLLPTEWTSVVSHWPKLRILHVGGRSRTGPHGFLSDEQEDALKTCVALEWLNIMLTDEELSVLRGFHRLRLLTLDNPKLDGSGLVNLAGLKNIQSLNLQHTSVADAPLETLAQLPKLSELVLTGTKVTNEGLGYLSSVARLESLSVSMTRMTLEGLQESGVATRLRFVEIDRSQSSTQSLARAKAAGLLVAVADCFPRD